MSALLITMLERLAIIVTIAFILTRLKFFKNMFYQDHFNHQQHILALIFFGSFGIIGTYTGLILSPESLQFNRWTSDLTTNEAIANSRVIGVVLGGLLGGYKVGIGAGINRRSSPSYSRWVYSHFVRIGNYHCRRDFRLIPQEE